jgi:H+-translocating NAD(P) transhydrogenase subunit alpha
MVYSDQPEGSVTVGVPRERVTGERRVSLVPDVVEELTKLGLTVAVESGAGEAASFGDEAYLLAGARIESSSGAVHRQANILAKVQPPLPDEIELLPRGCFVISFLDSSRDADVLRLLEERGVIAFSFNAVPRITRAQAMDAMSSMSTVAGYKAVLLAANTIGRFFPMLMTAAGTVPPARVVVIGAGVAGLQALATARRLGAITAGCDARAAVREQIQSVGATFIDMSVPMEETEGEGGYARLMDEEFYRRERDAIREHIVAADVVVSTAQVPGARAPILIDEAMVRDMRSGSTIVDLAAEAGGNCELSVPGETRTVCGVSILAPLNVPSMVPVHASQMYARNVLSVIKLVVKDGALHIDRDDEIIRAACLTVPAEATTG